MFNTEIPINAPDTSNDFIPIENLNQGEILSDEDLLNKTSEE